jgi:hypothetical protein
VGEKGVCKYIKEWFKSIFPLFLTWLLRIKIPNTHGRFCGGGGGGGAGGGWGGGCCVGW